MNGGESPQLPVIEDATVVEYASDNEEEQVFERLPTEGPALEEVGRKSVYIVTDVSDEPVVPPPHEYFSKPWLIGKGFKSCPVSASNQSGLSRLLAASVQAGSGTRLRTSEEILQIVVKFFAHDIVHIDVLVGKDEKGLGSVTKACLDCGAGPNFIRTDQLPSGTDFYPLPADGPRVVGASGEELRLLGWASLWVHVGGVKSFDFFLVTKTLPVPLILGIAYQNMLVQALWIYSKTVLMTDGFYVPINMVVQRAFPVRCTKQQIIPPRTDV